MQDAKVVDELRTQYVRVKAPISALRLWEQVLTEAERQRLGGNIEDSFERLGTVGMWMELHGVSQVRAIVDLAHELGLLSDVDFRWLLREVGDKQVKTENKAKSPNWNRITGNLCWGEQVLRSYRIMAQPSNIQLILDAFESEGWPKRIDVPLPYGLAQQVHQTLRSLNNGLQRIRFHSQEGGQAITWSKC